ncbi:tubby C-terminal domain-like protein [Alteribacter natronophilus]|uniref:tubby C-terminal domain-like protein n=1 Tax=Alteribacter natronophilus TaxID=2583810 RepID=UPI00110F0608|nr:hypothetical protein [Alteribacter natronophilus]TMW71487.1 hypothetical protein FGB90_10615 [Alteribacter natronophilus]
MYYEYTSPLLRYSDKPVPLEGEMGTCGYLNLFYETRGRKWLARMSRHFCTNAEVKVGTVCVRIVQAPYLNTFPKKVWDISVNGEECGTVKSCIQRKRCLFHLRYDNEDFELCNQTRGTRTELVRVRDDKVAASFSRGAVGLAKRQRAEIHHPEMMKPEVILAVYHLFSLHFTRVLG